MKHYNSLGLGAYSIATSQNVQLGNEYLRLSIEALRSDDKEIELRRLKSCLISRLFEKEKK